MNNEAIIKKLELHFPQCWFRVIDGNITSGEGSYIDEMEAFNHNWWNDDPNENIWVMGVDKDLVAFSDDLGMHWECQDPGTYKLYES